MQVGDRVFITSVDELDRDVGLRVGSEGSVVLVDEKRNLVGVDFGRDFPGHSCHGMVLSRTGWFFSPEDLEVIV